MAQVIDLIRVLGEELRVARETYVRVTNEAAANQAMARQTASELRSLWQLLPEQYRDQLTLPDDLR